MDQVRSEIREVADDYKGFIDLDDKEFFETVDKRKQDVDERELEEKYTSLKRDFSGLKLKF